jgi:hypothetical protein
MIGDSPSDMEFSRVVGVRTTWIGYEANRKLRRERATELADASFASLPEVVEGLLGHSVEGAKASLGRFRRSAEVDRPCEVAGPPRGRSLLPEDT